MSWGPDAGKSVTDYAIYMLDPAGYITSWNTGAERFKGYTADEIIGEHFSKFYSAEDQEAGLPARALATAEAEGRFESEGWRYRKDGGRFWANAIIDPIRDDDGALVGFAKITRDLTELPELPELITWAHGRGCDITLIEAMPLGEIEVDRTDQFLSLKDVRRELESFWTLTDIDHQTGGPARYVRVAETGGRLGFITPLSHNFCEACNRVRLTCTGTLHTCLGREDASDLRAVIRAGASDADLVDAIRLAIDAKPQGHDFQIARAAAPAVARHMSTTGG